MAAGVWLAGRERRGGEGREEGGRERESNLVLRKERKLIGCAEASKSFSNYLFIYFTFVALNCNRLLHLWNRLTSTTNSTYRKKYK